MARTSSAALAVLLLSSMTLLALASVPVVKNKATEVSNMPLALEGLFVQSTVVQPFVLQSTAHWA
jgi:hypothetical protein